MRQINFIIVFLFAFALVWLSLQNTESTTIKIVTGVEFEAPLAIALIVAMGIGSALAWFFTQLFRLQSLLESRQALREIRDKNARIEELEADLQQYQAETEADRDPPLTPLKKGGDNREDQPSNPENSDSKNTEATETTPESPNSENSDPGDRPSA